MSKNALALVDCSSRDKLFHFLINTYDRKATKKEMISPYDDQLIGKMNFRYSGTEHAMFFTYARSSEYPGMKFRNHKVIYLSLDVNDISSAIFQQLCSRFGGYVIHNDDVDDTWVKVERQQTENDDDLMLAEDLIEERRLLFDTEVEGQERKVYKELKLEPDMEEEAEEREWAPPVSEVKESKSGKGERLDKKQENNRDKREQNNKNHRGGRQERDNKKPAAKDNVKENAKVTVKEPGKDNINEGSKPVPKVTIRDNSKEQPEENKNVPKITVRENIREINRERNKERLKESKQNRENKEHKDNSKESNRENNKDNKEPNKNPNHRRGHRGGRKHSGKPQQNNNGQGNGAKNAAQNNSDNKTQSE